MMELLPLIFALVVLAAAFYAAAGQESSSVRQEEFSSETLGRRYQYRVYLPAGYTTSGAQYPVIYLLHGRGDTMDAWLNVRDTLDAMIHQGTLPPLIAIMPDMPSSDRASYYVDSQYTGRRFQAEAVETAFFNDLIPHVEAAYRTLTRRESRLVGGYSMGGYGAIRYSMAHPEIFTGALVLSPAVYVPLPPADSSTREFGAFGSGDALFSEEVYQSLNYPALTEALAQSALPLYLFIAVGDDEWKNPDPANRLHDLDMEAHMLFNHVARISNIAAEFRVYNGGHDWDVWERGFEEGMRYLANFLDTGSSPQSQNLTGALVSTPGADYAGGIVTDSEGNLYQALSASGPVNGEAHHGEMDIVLIKYAPDGSVLWTQQFGTSATERAYGLVLDSTGNAAIAGYTNGDMDGQHPDNSDNDPFIVQFSADGERLWTLQFGDAQAADRAYALAVGRGDSLYVSGYTRGTLNSTNAGDKDIFLARVSPQGALQWIQQFGGEGEDKGLSLATGSDGTIYLAGVAGSALAEPVGDLDAYLAAYSPEGERLWLRQFGSAGWDEATGITVSGELIYVTGFAGDSFLDHAAAGDKDIIAAAFDTAGELIWSDLVGTPLNDKGADARVDAAGNLYIAAYTNGRLAGGISGFDVVLIRYDHEHTHQWIRQIGTEGDDGADEYAEENLYLHVDGERLLFSGLTTGTIGDILASGSYDVFLAETDTDGGE